MSPAPVPQAFDPLDGESLHFCRFEPWDRELQISELRRLFGTAIPDEWIPFSVALITGQNNRFQCIAINNDRRFRWVHMIGGVYSYAFRDKRVFCIPLTPNPETANGEAVRSEMHRTQRGFASAARNIIKTIAYEFGHDLAGSPLIFQVHRSPEVESVGTEIRRRIVEHTINKGGTFFAPRTKRGRVTSETINAVCQRYSERWLEIMSSEDL